MKTEEEDMMIGGHPMRGEVSGEGQGHLVPAALAEQEVVQGVRGTEDGQGHIVGHGPGPDLDQGHGANQGHDQDQGREKFSTDNSQIAVAPLQLWTMESTTQRLPFQPWEVQCTLFPGERACTLQSLTLRVCLHYLLHPDRGVKIMMRRVFV